MTVETITHVTLKAWTQFHDMHSGGGLKTKWHQIFIEAPVAEAKIIFEQRTGRDPDNETCSCCGGDYSISEEPTLEQATGYERGCKFDPDTQSWLEEPDTTRWAAKYTPLAEYVTREDVLVIRTTPSPPIGGDT